jgi:hypothetical protein
MTEELYLKGLIQDNLDQARLLRAQPEVDAKEIDDILWRVLGLSLELDELYAAQIREVDTREVVTIKEELFKRQEMVELSNRREEAISTMFDRDNADENSLAELFEDMRKETQYTTTFYESDVRLVQEQLDEVREANDRVAELRAERQSVENQIAAIRNNAVSFEDFNASLNEDYERFIVENEIDDIDLEQTMRERARRLERQAIINRNRELAKTATNVNVNDYRYSNALSDNEVVLHELDEKLFLYELGNLFRMETNSYEELLEKSKKIHAYVSDREITSSRINDLSHPNEISYRTVAFAMDVNNIENQINGPKRIVELEEKLNDIDVEIENAYNNVKGRKLLDDIINNKKPEYPGMEVDTPDEIEPMSVARADNGEEIEVEVVGPEEAKKFANTKDSDIVDAEIVESEVTDLVPLNEGEFEVIATEKAKPSLLEKIKKYKDKLVALGKGAIAATLAGGAAILAKLKGKKDKEAIEEDIEQVVEAEVVNEDAEKEENEPTPLNEGEFEVVATEKAKQTLLDRVKQHKDKLILVGKVAVVAVLAGSIIGLANLNVEKAKQEELQNNITIEQPADLNPNIIDSVIDEGIDQVVEAYSPTVGDKVNVGEGVKYYRDSSVAQLEQNSYETGKSGLKPGDYNVNRIALLAKDANGQPTGKIIDVNTTAGVSAEALAESLGLPKGNYDVIMHIGRGDENGNYLEANKGSQSPDDLCWIKTDGTYSNGLSLTKAASEVLEMNAERGMSR